MKEEAGASVGVETAHQTLELQIVQLRFFGTEGRIAPIADFIETHITEPRAQSEAAEKKRLSLDEVTPARRILTLEQEKVVMEALIAALKGCYQKSDIEAVAGMLRREKVPEFVKVEVIWECEKLGWAAPLRVWMPTTREKCAEVVRRKAIEGMDAAFRESTLANVVEIRGPRNQTTQRTGGPKPTALAGRY